MSTATLSHAPATQLTFPWAMPKAESEAVIVADRSGPSNRAGLLDVAVPSDRAEAAGRVFGAPSVACALPSRHSKLEIDSQDGTSLADAMCGDRIGKPFRVGSVMFRLLKSYGITDEEIADGVAQYTAKRADCR